MEHESSLPFSHDPATGPYFEAHIPCYNFPQTFENCFKSSILYMYLHLNGRNALLWQHYLIFETFFGVCQ